MYFLSLIGLWKLSGIFYPGQLFICGVAGGCPMKTKDEGGRKKAESRRKKGKGKGQDEEGRREKMKAGKRKIKRAAGTKEERRRGEG